MSKSLKNFVTIKDALKRHSARQLRLAFLLHNWKDMLDYSDNTMQAAVSYEKLVNEFFLTVKDILRRSPATGSASFSKWDEDELQLNEKLLSSQSSVHEALCDSVDTRAALDAMRELVSSSNVYIDSHRKSGIATNRLLLQRIATYVTKMLRTFGAIKGDETIGFAQAVSQGGNNVEELVMPYLSAFAKFRDDVRQVARQQKVGDILKVCDEVRDDVLPNIGVRLEDHEGQETVIKLVDREILLKEREEKLRQEELKRLEKEKKKAEKESQQAAKDAQKKIAPSELFRLQTDKFSQFDENGMPTHDVLGKELSKSQLKKLSKLYEAQEKKYRDYMTSLEQGDSAMKN
ncbi:Cysteine--tRNA ligase, cytoplasmic [Lamellibrachia satsuma]|nr:Cysteine--tRNA ligase, cytoplasmic [Lamellibrachia satsuma]